MRFLPLALALFAQAAALPAIAQTKIADPARMDAVIKTLASDAFEGRSPGSAGETRTVDYLLAQFKAAGLQPAGDKGSFVQDVPLLHTQIQSGARFSYAVKGETTALAQVQDLYAISLQPQDKVAIKDAPLVFVGYGVTAPERGWDDFKGVDLKGKVAVMLINDPDFEAQAGEPVAGKFGGQAMTYYGRWIYKFEEAARRGAVAALIIHETPGAGYGWSTVTAPGGEGFDIVRADPAQEKVQLQAWITRDAGAALLAKAGLDLDALKVQARSAAFRPAPLDGVTFSADFGLTHDQVMSHNIIGKLPGRTHPEESVMFSAHWDAFGIGAPDAHGDRIRRGAADDGTGIAGVLELARAFKALGPTDRTTVYAAWTAEERGLLGSELYGLHPTVSLPKMAANFTMDTLQTAGPSHDVVLIGYGQNQLDEMLAKAAAGQDRTVTPDAHPERGLFYRADHFPLAKHGVPVLILMGLGGGPDLVKGGRAAGEAWVNAFTANCYHKACDAWRSDWDLTGAAQDVDLLYVMGKAIATSRTWPQWKAGSEFKPVRDETAGLRK
ncbi:M28 family peptidase [Phenylobacterium aquaticum]|uniref:M28 family peptidase n=1 Tax=Phenylobacterium aquaticum TaxID=1763816 RepID=UPI0026F040EB|nr:M28 family peptidase [Phenylobacterium aquaticum]